MRKMRLDLDTLVVEAFPTDDGGEVVRGTVRLHSAYFDIHSNTGGFQFCICPREVNESVFPC